MTRLSGRFWRFVVPGLVATVAIGSKSVVSPTAFSDLSWTSAQAPQMATAEGTVSEANGGRPIAGADVTVIRGFSRMATTTTDRLGHFVLLVPTAEPYVLRATKAGYFDGEASSLSSAAANPVPGNQQQVAVAIRMWKYASMSGVVMDAAGRPVAGATVSAWPKIFVAGEEQLVKGVDGQTNDRGEYRLPGLQQGEYLLSARPPEGAVNAGAVRPCTFLPNVASADVSSTVSIGPGDDRTDLDFTLLSLVGRTVAGSASAGFAIPSGVHVSMLPDGLQSVGVAAAIGTARLDDYGRFSFAGVPSGVYWLIVDSAPISPTYGADGSLPVSLTLTGLLSAPVPFYGRGNGLVSARKTTTEPASRVYGHVQVVVDTEDLSDVSFPIHAGARMSGDIVFDSHPDEATHVAMLLAEPVDGNFLSGVGIARVQLTATGTPFVIDGLGDSAFTLNLAEAEGLAIRSIAIGSRDLTGQSIDMRTGFDITDLRVQVTAHPAVLTGTVQHSRSSVTSVLLFPIDPTSWTAYGLNPSRIRSVPVNDAGAFRIDGLAAGDYYVVAVPASHRNDWRDPRALARIAGRAKRVTLTWATTQAVDLDLQ